MSPGELTRWTDGFDAETRMHCWAMASTGMGPIEYFGEIGDPIPWEVRAEHVWIAGARKAGDGEACKRVVPDIGRCAERPTISQDAFSQRIRKRTKGAWTPYDLRRTYANWLEEIRVRPSRIKLYMGHSLSDVTELYTAHDVKGHLGADAQLLRRFIDERTHG